MSLLQQDKNPEAKALQKDVILGEISLAYSLAAFSLRIDHILTSYFFGLIWEEFGNVLGNFLNNSVKKSCLVAYNLSWRHRKSHANGTHKDNRAKRPFSIL